MRSASSAENVATTNAIHRVCSHADNKKDGEEAIEQVHAQRKRKEEMP